MDPTDIAALVACVIAQIAGIEPEHVRENALLEDLGVDALGRIEVALTLESELGRSVGSEVTWLTPADVVRACSRGGAR